MNSIINSISTLLEKYPKKSDKSALKLTINKPILEEENKHLYIANAILYLNDLNKYLPNIFKEENKNINKLIKDNNKLKNELKSESEKLFEFNGKLKTDDINQEY
jgi:hypothetical protein